MSRIAPSLTLIGYLLRGALADRLLLALVLLLAGASALAAFLGTAALAEQRELATVYGAAATRLVVVVALALFTCFQLRRAFDTREVDLLLSRPISRPQFVLAHLALLATLAAFAALMAGLAVGLLARPSTAEAASVGIGAVSIWTLSLWIEATVVAMVALFFALMLTSGVAAALASLGFYVLARTLGVLDGIAAQAGNGTPADQALGWLLDLFLLALPRLDLLGQSGWLVHGIEGAPHLTGALAQGIAYVLLLAAAASFDFGRRPL